MLHEHSAGSVIYRQMAGQTKFLIVKSVLHHTWGFPKGHLDLKKHETEQEAARREVREEVGLRPDFDFSFRRQVTYRTEEHTIKTVGFFIASFVSGQKVVNQKEEILASRWVSLMEAKNYLLRPGLYEVLIDAANYLKQKQ